MPFFLAGIDGKLNAILGPDWRFISDRAAYVRVQVLVADSIADL